MDDPQPPAVPLATRTADPRKTRDGMSNRVAAECGRGTGRNAAGDCVPLLTRDLGHVQRVQLPAGVFVMGGSMMAYDASESRERKVPGWSRQPPHLERTEAFWIDLHEVTRGAYEKCVAESKCTVATCPDGTDPTENFSAKIAPHIPQTCVTFEQAGAYCAAMDGRLPSEVEWEYASRGTDARIYPWGNELDDGMMGGLGPVGRQRMDSSYFGILGMGTNAVEWVSDVYDPDRHLRSFLEREFRDPKGVVAKTRSAYERRLACGSDRGCRATARDRERHVVKMTRGADRFAARVKMPAHPTGEELEGWSNHAHHAKLGFRCAADLSPGDEVLHNPADPPALPLIRGAGALEIFGGVASGVSKSEARAFCEGLTVDEASTGATLTDWRLPTRHEIRTVAPNFRGPGPFWARNGALEQRGAGPSPRPNDPWVDLDAADPEALAVRCVRDAS